MNELTSYRSFGSAGYLCKLVRRIGEGGHDEDDLSILMANDFPLGITNLSASLVLLQELGLYEKSAEDGFLRLTNGIASLQNDDEQLKRIISEQLLAYALDNCLIPIKSLRFDSSAEAVYLPAVKYPLRFSAIRNVLIEFGGLVLSEGNLYVSSELQHVLESRVAPSFDGMSPDELLKELELERYAGELAESFVLEYEKERLGEALAGRVKQVSKMSVEAGFDIASFESSESITFDRFIEVKALGRNGFYISSGELKKARELGTQYLLCIVKMKMINNPGYVPEFIRDPISEIENSSMWRVKATGYHVTPVP